MPSLGWNPHNNSYLPVFFQKRPSRGSILNDIYQQKSGAKSALLYSSTSLICLDCISKQLSHLGIGDMTLAL